MKKTLPVVAFISMLLLFASTLIAMQVRPVSSAEATENFWVSKKPMPTARMDLGVAFVSGKIYAIGGSDNSGYLDTNEMYDPKTDTWTTMKPMPTPRCDFGITVYQGKIYVIGGYASYKDYEESNK